MRAERGLRGRAEVTAWAILIALNLVTHFWSLGLRAMSHDESLHGFYSHQLADKGEFKHDPMMHGPLLFHASALVFRVLGESDATARVYPALLGVALVAFLFVLRRYLGRWGALLAALLLSLSPSVLFYGRYMRNDVVISLYSLLWIFAAFRYLETRRPRFVSLMALAMALCFTTKETCFIFGAIIGAWFVGMAVARRLRRGEAWSASASGELALVMLTLVLPFAVALGYRALGFDPRDFDGPQAARRAGVMIALCFVISGLLALLGIGRSGRGAGRPPLSLRAWGRAMAIFWSIAVVLYTTVFTNVPRGLISGIVGSLGYWLSEHSTGRGGQPWFYYVFLGSLYEFLPLVLGALGIVWVVGGSFGRGRRARFADFLAWWGLASLAAYSMAGEKMPWLLVHVAVPFCLLGGVSLGRLVSAIDWPRLRAAPALLALLAPGAAVLLLGPLLWLQPFAGRDSEAVARTARFFLHLGAGAGLLAFAWVRLRARCGPAHVRLLALGSAAFLAALTARSALMLSFVNFDLATEFLVYAHATPDIKRALAEIDEIAARTGRGNELEVAYDDDSAWPLTWYLRVYPKQRFYSDTPTSDAMSAPVVIVGKKNFEKAEPFLGSAYVRRDYRLVWWPVEGYARITWADVVATLRDAKRRQELLEILWYRRYPGVSFAEWPYRHEFRLYVRRDLAAQVWPLGLTVPEAAAPASAVQYVPELRCSPIAEYAGPYAGLPLKAPAAVAVGPDGARLIADTENHRVVVLEPDGKLRTILGGRCEVARVGACDGRFLEPWGVASGPRGEIVVADTWNGRVQVFDAGGHFLRTWGALGLDQAPPVPMDRLYGPRGVAVDEGRERTVVSDTGHKRLVLFDHDGRALFEVGGAGSAPGLFDEPVGVAVDQRDGSLFVADAWNRRIQKLGPDLDALASWPVPGWGGRDLADKPYVAVDDHGNVYASVPSQSRVVVFSPAGALLLSLVGSDWNGSTPARPAGLWADPASGTLLVADTARDRVVALPLVRSAAEGCR